MRENLNITRNGDCRESEKLYAYELIAAASRKLKGEYINKIIE